MAFGVWLNENLNLLKSPYLNQMEAKLPEIPDSLKTYKPAKLEDLKFVFSQAEKRVKESSDDGDKINNKSLTIIGICLTLITGLIGYVITNAHNKDFPLLASAIYIVISLVVVCCKLKPNIYPKRYLSVGSYPADLMSDNMYENTTDVDTTEYRMIYSEILAYQQRIMQNKKNNDSRNARLRKAYDILFQIPIFSVVCYLVVLLLSLIFDFGVSFCS
jgi:hypothetical protein